MEYYLAIKEEIFSFATARMQVEIAVIRQAQKSKYHMIFLGDLF
jgi:hypothetical protein